ncbi:hypothetical protein A6A22_19525 [Arthrobacter sp. OY3WO11]|nr:hypothetical protein A6A22_19525 [Arthrobacter sp. OY3WO11]
MIVGASAGGTSAAEALRARGHEGPIILIGSEQHAPYDRPPLSKQVLGSAPVDSATLALRGKDHLRDLGIEERYGVTADDLDLARRRVELSDGTAAEFDRLIIATGVAARKLPHAEGLAGVHTLRTIDDALKLRSALTEASRVVVIGGGFLGTEVAAAAAGQGAGVTIASSSRTLLQSAVGELIGQQVTDLHRGNRVRVRAGSEGRVRTLQSRGGRVSGVTFVSGAPEPADLVVVCIGSEPAVDWLRFSGLAVEDGVQCASDCSAAEGVYAVGDVATWHNPRFNMSMRVEHRTNATEQALHVAERIMAGDRTPYAPVPYFWSDQYDLKLQAHGYLRGHDEVHVAEGDLTSRRLIALYRRGPALTGVLAVGAAKALRQWRSRIESGMNWDDAIGLT